MNLLSYITKEENNKIQSQISCLTCNLALSIKTPACSWQKAMQKKKLKSIISPEHL